MEINTIHIDLIRKPIRRMHLRVYADGRVVVTAPWLMPSRIIKDFIEKKTDWIIAAQRQLQRQPQPQPQRQRQLPTVTNEKKKELIEYLNKNVEKWRIIMGEEPVTWTIRNMRTQWGNCRAQRRKLTFNLQLALVEDRLKDYIIVHELAHLKVQNHGPLFKARETEFMPDWKERREQLKGFSAQCTVLFG